MRLILLNTKKYLPANEAINKIGKFYTSYEEFKNHGDFTNLYAELLKSYRWV